MSPAKNTPSKSAKDANPTEVSPDAESAAPPVENADVPSVPENHDDLDVERAKQRKTQDGKGDDEVPESDFDSFATDGVEKGTKTVEEVAQDVLDGKHGWDWRPFVEKAGYNPSEVQTEVNRRVSTGAPSSLPRQEVSEIAAQVIRGEWGDGAQVEQRLTGAGHYVNQISDEVEKQLGN